LQRYLFAICFALPVARSHCRLLFYLLFALHCRLRDRIAGYYLSAKSFAMLFYLRNAFAISFAMLFYLRKAFAISFAMLFYLRKAYAISFAMLFYLRKAFAISFAMLFYLREALHRHVCAKSFANICCVLGL
jgi:hypothetical protein